MYVGGKIRGKTFGFIFGFKSIIITLFLIPCFARICFYQYNILC